MNFVYILEGQLKYESIEYDAHLTFELYNKNGTVGEKQSADTDVVYFLANEMDVSISIDSVSNKIYIYSEEEVQVILSGKDGLEIAHKTNNEIEITDDLVKFSIPELNFSFLLNVTEEPAGLNDNLNAFDLKRILIQNKSKIKYLLPIIILAIIGAMYLFRGGVKTNRVVFFNDQSELMKANLTTLRSHDVLVKSELKSRIEKLLDEIGIKYIRFDLIEREEKINLVLYVFEKKNDDLERSLSIEQIFWLNEIVFQALDPKSMYEDFNSIANKYNLEKQDIFNRDLTHLLVIINMTNNNLKYNSLQRDLKVFVERWGRNYIDFNVNLVQKKEMTFDFMMRNGDETIIKSGQGYYFN